VGHGRKGNAHGGLGDRGVFHIYSNEEKVGTNEFEVSPDGSYRGQTTITRAGQRVVYTLDLETDGSRRWTKVVAGSSLGVVTVRRGGAHADVILPDSITSVRVHRDCLLFEAFSPTLIGQIIGRVDRRRAGPQKVPLFLTVGGCRVATVQAAGVQRRVVGDRQAKLECFHLTVAGVRVQVWADTGRICLVEAPAYHASLVRRWVSNVAAAWSSPRISIGPTAPGGIP
jgi:hypothetical protein